LSWQYLFIIEGCVPIILGILAPFWLANDVRSAWYLNKEERAFAERRMIVDSAANFNNSHNVTRKDFYEAFTDWKVWGIMLSNTLASLSSQGFTIFFPVVVKVGLFTFTLVGIYTINNYWSRVSVIVQVRQLI
jgi:hypothetical protein